METDLILDKDETDTTLSQEVTSYPENNLMVVTRSRANAQGAETITPQIVPKPKAKRKESGQTLSNEESSQIDQQFPDKINEEEVEITVEDDPNILSEPEPR